MMFKTLIVDEIPGGILDQENALPGRIVLVDHAGRTLWENTALKMPYDAAPLPARDGYWVSIIRARAIWQLQLDGVVVSQLPVGGYPCSVQRLANGHLLVAGWDDDVPGFVREFAPTGAVVWQAESLCWPWKAERLTNGHTLIADAGQNRVFELDRAGDEVWAVAGLGPAEPALFDALGPVYCQRLGNGNTLVSIRALNRVVEFDRAGRVVWEVGEEVVAKQYSAMRLASGHTLIADAGHGRVIEIDAAGEIVWQCGGFGYPAKAYRL